MAQKKTDVFASRLRQLREAAGLSTHALAERAGVSQAQVSLVEAGKRSPGWAVATKLADALGVSVADFR